MSSTTGEAPHCYRHPARETWIRCQRCDRPICPDCMVGAAVGFQCPECVKQGAKSTRQGRAAYGGARSANPLHTTIALIAVNVAVWLLLTAHAAWASVLSLLPEGRCEVSAGSDRFYPGITDGATCAQQGAHWVGGVADGSWWQVLTSVFTHVEVAHLGFNMLALFFLGPMLEAVLGRARFLAVYLVAGLAGSALVMVLSDPTGETLGASGAIFGLMGALLVLGAKVGSGMQTIWFWLALNLVYTFTGNGISWQGHVGGLVGGGLAAAVIAFSPRSNRPLFQWSGLVLLAVVSLVVIGVRAAAL